ncbi:MAG: hypothetical protein LUE26_06565 [Alistipes sp.]|nr:hypothetical protein [Alistipes sp.]
MDNNDELVDYAVQTRTLKLTVWEKISYFFPPFVIAATAAAIFGLRLADRLNGVSDKVLSTGDMALIIGLLFGAGIIYSLISDRLRFTVVDTILDISQFHIFIKDITDHYGFRIESWQKESVLFDTATGPLTTKTQVTVIYRDNKVYINSICPPYERQLFSSNNEKNIQRIIEELRDEEVKYTQRT